MAQEEILELLRQKDEMTAKEISEMLGIAYLNARMGLIRLLKEQEVERIKLDSKKVKGVRFVWKLKK